MSEKQPRESLANPAESFGGLFVALWPIDQTEVVAATWWVRTNVQILFETEENILLKKEKKKPSWESTHTYICMLHVCMSIFVT